MQRLYFAECAGRSEDVNRTILEFSSKYPDFYESTSLVLFGQNVVGDTVKKIIADSRPAESLSEIERLNKFNALVLSRSIDVSLMEKLLAFQSDNESFEANRIFSLITVAALKRDWRDANKDLIRALVKAPILNSGILGALFNLDGKSMPESEIDEVRKAIGSKGVLAVNPTLLANAKKYLDSGADFNSWERYDLIEAAFNSCPSDASIDELYAYVLIRQKKFNVALSVLKPLIQNQKFPSAQTEFLFAQMNDGLGKADVAAAFFKKSCAPENLYISDAEKEYACERLASIERSDFWIRILAVTLFGIVSVGVFIYRKRNNQR